MQTAPYDVVGIGVGPFNLGLACLVQPIEDLKCLFLERNEEFNWHPGMLLENATLQTPFLSDLVTLADPTSEFSFLNYLKQQGRIYSFYSFLITTQQFVLLRNDFNQYCRWAAGRLGSLAFGREVERVEFEEGSGLYAVRSRDVRTGEQATHRARRLVLASGTAPWVPEFCEPHRDRIVHTSSYMENRDRLRSMKSITIVGSGQSAAEVYYDLLKDIDHYGYSLHWLTRSPRFFPMELTKMTTQMTSPEYTEYFFSLPTAKRNHLVAAMKDVYQGINASLLNDIYDLLYRKRLVCDLDTTLMANTELTGCSYDAASGGFRLSMLQKEQERAFEHETEGLVMATGYRFRPHTFLEPVEDRINRCEDGRLAVARNYTIDKRGSEIFVQNAELHAEGFVPPDLGQACFRNSSIIRELLGREHYAIERSVAFQRFSAPEGALAATGA
jgi:lysine N6-hydroxylase